MSRRMVLELPGHPVGKPVELAIGHGLASKAQRRLLRLGARHRFESARDPTGGARAAGKLSSDRGREWDTGRASGRLPCRCLEDGPERRLHVDMIKERAQIERDIVARQPRPDHQSHLRYKMLAFHRTGSAFATVDVVLEGV